MSKDSYVQGLLCPGVISFRGSNPFPGVLTYITLSLSFRASDILGFLYPGFLHSRILMSRGSFVQLLLFPVVIMFGVITFMSSNVHNIVIVIQALRYPWVLTFRDSYIQGCLCSEVLMHFQGL